MSEEKPDNVVALPPAPPVLAPKDWTLTRIAALVRDVAQDIYELPDILIRNRLTPQQFKLVSDNEFFRNAVEQFKLEWFSASNTHKRISLEAAIALEEALPDVVTRARSPNEPLNEVVSLVKLLAEIAGTVGAKAVAQQQATPTERFRITFNIGTMPSQTHEATISVTPNPPTNTEP